MPDDHLEQVIVAQVLALYVLLVSRLFGAHHLFRAQASTPQQVFQFGDGQRLFNVVDAFELNASLGQDPLDLTARASSRFLIDGDCEFLHASSSWKSFSNLKSRERSCPGGIVFTVKLA